MSVRQIKSARVDSVAVRTVRSCCASGHCCASGYSVCCSNGGCCLSGYTCCGSNYRSAPGYTCCNGACVDTNMKFLITVAGVTILACLVTTVRGDAIFRA